MKSEVTSLPTGSQERWLLDQVGTRPTFQQHCVFELLPPGYERYVRVLHPFEPWNPEASPLEDMPTWRQLADLAHVVYHPLITWETLRPILGGPDGPRPYSVDNGRLSEPARSRLLEVLADTSDDAEAFFYFGMPAWMSIGKPLLYRAPLRSLGEVDARAAADTNGPSPIPGPEYFWPFDRSWVVSTDYDLVSTYIACNGDLADRLLSDGILETFQVSLDSRVDDLADSLNGVVSYR
jgi:hypothetical protein